jgi:CRP-like cAMP-binding protein
MLETIPAFASGFHAGIQKSAIAKDQRIIASLSASAEERYIGFLQKYPSIAQRVPQHMLASYLGVSPETLSRVRKQMSRKK